MNKTYTDRYLIKDITNKQFKHKYGVKKKVVTYKADNNASNRETWMQRILRKNPWLREPEPMFDSLQPEDQAHLDSIANIT